MKTATLMAVSKMFRLIRATATLVDMAAPSY